MSSSFLTSLFTIGLILGGFVATIREANALDASSFPCCCSKGGSPSFGGSIFSVAQQQGVAERWLRAEQEPVKSHGALVQQHGFDVYSKYNNIIIIYYKNTFNNIIIVITIYLY